MIGFPPWYLRHDVMTVTNLRTYGKAPFNVVVVHGGPGAGGEMAPVARHLASHCGVLEPIQTALSVDGQIDELRETFEKHAGLPVVLIGHSWGAWLALLTAARHPALVKRLILVSGGPFDVCYVAGMHETRMSRLNDDERSEFNALITGMNDALGVEKDRDLARLGELVSISDDFDSIPGDRQDADRVATSGEIFQRVWPEAAELRVNGLLLEAARKLTCPVLAIHGDYDPHPADGVARPLAEVIEDFQFVLLEQCGHTPWIERFARDEFFEVIDVVTKGPVLPA